MTALLAIGAGAGIVSALLFSVVATGSPFAIFLSYLAPLPIFIAALGWHHRAGLVAAAVGILVTLFAFRLSAGIAFGVGLALPAWWLAYLALLGRPNAAGVMEWYPLGRLLVWIAAVATLVTFAGALALGGTYEEFRATMRAAIGAMLRSEGSSGAAPPIQGPGGISRDDLLDMIAAAVPVMTAASFVPMQTANLWLAAKAVATSGRLTRPWPSIPDTAMPRAALLALAAALLSAWLLGGFASLVGQALAGALGAAFALQGLAAIHALTRGKKTRGAILGGVYVLVVVFLLWMLPILAIAGVLDALVRPRDRRVGPGNSADPKP